MKANEIFVIDGKQIGTHSKAVYHSGSSTVYEEIEYLKANSGGDTTVTVTSAINGVYLRSKTLKYTYDATSITLLPQQDIIEIHYTNMNKNLSQAPLMFNFTITENLVVGNMQSLRVNLETGALRVVSDATYINNEFILLRCLNDGTVTGEFFRYVKKDTTLENIEISIPSVERFIDKISVQGISIVGDEIWYCSHSNDEHTDFANITRYKISDFTQITPSISHNLGHMNTLSYDSNLDMMLMGNGSKSYTLPMKAWIFKNVSTWKTNNAVNFDTAEKVELDFTSINESKCNVIWGENINNKRNIIYLLSNDGRNIRRIMLGKGIDNLGNGIFISNATNDYNGSWKVIDFWSQSFSLGVVQDAIYHNGSIYMPTNTDNISSRVSGSVLCKFTPCLDGTLKKQIINIPVYTYTARCLGQGVDIKDNKIYLVTDAGTNIFEIL